VSVIEAPRFQPLSITPLPPTLTKYDPVTLQFDVPEKRTAPPSWNDQSPPEGAVKGFRNVELV